MIRILIADDHDIIRRGLTHMINEKDDMSVIANAKNGEEAVIKALNLQPDIVIMDIHMPRKDGLQATKEILRRNSSIKIIILTSDDRKDTSFRSLEAGALGFLLKSNTEFDLIDAIRTVYRGSAYLKPDVTKQLLDNYVLNSK